MDRRWGSISEDRCFRDSSTGTTFDREAIQRMLRICKENPLPLDSPGRVELYDPTRFGRPLKNGIPDTREYRRVLWEFEDAGWIITFATLNRSGDDLTDEMMILLHANSASQFSAKLSEDVRRGKFDHAQRGFWIHGQAPLGTLPKLLFYAVAFACNRRIIPMRWPSRVLRLQ